MSLIARLSAQPWVVWLLQRRFLKFGTVGASGTLVNLGMLYLAQEYLFRAIQPPEMRLNVSLVVAIFFATLNNFLWNRAWTWRDRKHHHRHRSRLAQFGQYAMACWVGIALQVVFTKLLVVYFHYLIANALAILLSSIFNFAVNDLWTFRHRKAPAQRLTTNRAADNLRVPWLLYGLAILLAVFIYFFGLDGQHIPKNGDEYPYAHITRLTAESGRLLPLQSELDGMRNTKPPMLFWQGIASTNWGQNWTLWHLRYPSVIYTLLTSLLIFLLGWKLSLNPSKGFIGTLAFLAFYSTYRYGRPFLTNPPEVFWLFLPFFVLLYWRATAFASRLVPLLLGIVVGIGLLYKSFALLLPVLLCLAWWYLRQRDYKIVPFLVADAWKLALVAVISLAIFSLWFLLDPQPQAIWQEFVVQENAGKFDPHSSSGYLAKLLWGGSSIWMLALGYPLNAGLLAFPVLGLMIDAFRRRAELSDAEKMLWIWLLVLFFVFGLPSQRSSRYLLAAMPALAVLCALGWERISRLWFICTLVFAVVVVAGLAYLQFRLQGALPEDALHPAPYWLLLATLVFALAALLIHALTRPGACVTVLLAFLSLTTFLRPFDGALGNYSAETQRRVTGAEVWVPYDFNAKYESYRFLLPGAKIQGYREQRNQDIDELALRYPVFSVRAPLGTKLCKGCRLLGERLDLRGRQSSEEIREILRGKVFEYIFLKDMLIEAPVVADSGRQ